jgi:hypothetical protein
MPLRRRAGIAPVRVNEAPRARGQRFWQGWDATSYLFDINC